MCELPNGTVTFLFTDIEGSTKLAREYPDMWDAVQGRHNSILRAAIESNHGFVFQIIGDAFCSSFHKPGDALQAALKAQRDLQTSEFSKDSEVSARVRMGIHTGEAETDGKDYHGYLTLSLVQRVMSAGHGGQILLSNTTENLLRGQLPKDISLRDLGEHNLKDAPQPVQIFQVIAPDLQQDFPTLRAMDVLSNNLPIQTTPFIGREAELQELSRLISDPSVRLLTILGVGGIGKTRLAIEAGRGKIGKFERGVFFVPLAGLQSADSIAPAIAKALDFSFYKGGEPRQQLLDYLREKQMLLILDNFEHLLEGASLVSEILQTAGKVKVIVTSRARINLQSECLFHLEGMDFPDWETPADAMGYSAVQLFLQSARRARPEFELAADDLKFVSRICKLVGGMPLGILLTAAWVQILDLPEIAKEIEKSIDFLATDLKDVSERQRSMRAVFDYSWSLLTEQEQKVFRGLSVFRGGFTREAAQQVTGATLLDLMGLVDKSLLHRTPTGRYEIHELLRQYALDRLLESGEAEILRNCHRDWFLVLAELAAPELLRGTQLEWLDRLDKEIENLRAALDWALEQEEAESALRIAAALAYFWDIRGYDDEAHKYYESVLTLSNNLENLRYSRGRARILTYLSILMAYQADFDLLNDTHHQRIQEALDIYKKLDDKAGSALLLGLKADERNDLGDTKEAIAIGEEAIAAARASGEKYTIALTLLMLANFLPQDDYYHCRSLYEESLDNIQSVGDRQITAAVLEALGQNVFFHGNPEEAQGLFIRALSNYQQLKHRRANTRIYFHLGRLASEQGQYEIAVEYYQKSSEIAREINDKFSLSVSLWLHGQTELYQMNFHQASNYLQECLEIINSLHDDERTALFQADLGFLYLCENKDIEADAIFRKCLEVLYDKPHSIRGAIRASNGLGELARRKGEFAESVQYYHQSTKLVPKDEPAYTLEYCLEGLAKTISEMGNFDHAGRLFAAAAAMRSNWRGVIHPVFRADYDKYIAMLLKKLGDAVVNSIWTEGQSMTIEQAIELALRDE